MRNGCHLGGGWIELDELEVLIGDELHSGGLFGESGPNQLAVSLLEDVDGDGRFGDGDVLGVSELDELPGDGDSDWVFNFTEEDAGTELTVMLLMATSSDGALTRSYQTIGSGIWVPEG